MSTVAIEKLLGGTELIGRPIRSDMDLYELGKAGIPKKSLCIWPVASTCL